MFGGDRDNRMNLIRSVNRVLEHKHHINVGIPDQSPNPEMGIKHKATKGEENSG
jgi:hypothetical protein